MYFISTIPITDTWRLFMVNGANEDEAHLNEVFFSSTQLRSQTSYIFLNSENGRLFIWHGKESSEAFKKVIIQISNL